jgi:hypothetical protein
VGGAPADTEGGEVVLIPLRKSSDGGGGLFEVEIVYARREDPATLWTGPFEVVAPAADLLANRVDWDIYLPESRYVYRADGDLKPAAAGRVVAEAVGRGVRPAGWERRPETIRRLREGIERFHITDINNPASASAGTGEPRYDGAQSKEAVERVQGLAPMDTRVAGVLPIPVSFPIEGRRLSFERVLAPQDTALKMKFYTIDGRLVAAGRKGVRLLPVIAGCLAGLVLGRAVRGRRVGAVRLALLVVVSAAVFAMAIASGAVFKTLVVYVLVACVVPAVRPMGRYVGEMAHQRREMKPGGRGPEEE